MTENDRCSFCARPNVVAVVIGVGSFIVFGMIAIISGVLLGLEVKQMGSISPDHAFTKQNVLGLEIKYVTMNAMLVAVLIVSTLATFFSVLLIIGVLKHLSGLVLSYFCFGILTTMLMLLGCLLLLIHNLWYISIVLFVATVLYTSCLLVVYKFYERIIAGTYLTFNREDLIEEELLNEDRAVAGTRGK